MPPESKYAKGVVKREEILAAAMQLIAREGYNSATVRQLAEAVGLSKTGVVHHFGTKEELFVELLRRRDLFQPSPPDDLPSTDVVDAVLAKIEDGLTAPGLIELHVRFGAESSAPDHPAHRFFTDRYAALDGLGSRTFEGLRAAGRLAPHTDPAKLAVLFAAVLDGLQMRSLFTEELDVMSHLTHLFEIVSASGPEEPDPMAGHDHEKARP